MELLVRTNPMMTTMEVEELGLADFAEQVRRYDTWDWTKLGDNNPRYLHELLMIIGREEFLKRFTEDLNPQLTQSEQYLVDMELKRIDRFIKGKEKQMIKSKLHGYNIGFVYAEQHHSVLGNTICTNHPDIDFVVIMNMGAGKVSFRAVKDDINTGEFAKKYYGGGGHPKASGCEFSKDDIINSFFDIMDKQEPVDEFINYITE
jgi:uncharacterized protein